MIEYKIYRRTDAGVTQIFGNPERAGCRRMGDKEPPAPGCILIAQVFSPTLNGCLYNLCAPKDRKAVGNLFEVERAEYWECPEAEVVDVTEIPPMQFLGLPGILDNSGPP
jgi:hypothetical protein